MPYLSLHFTFSHISTIDASLKAHRDFRHEALMQAPLSTHPNIVALIGISVNPCALLFEFVPYVLNAYILDLEKDISWPLRLRIAQDIAEAMKFMHSSPSHDCHCSLLCLPSSVPEFNWRSPPHFSSIALSLNPCRPFVSHLTPDWPIFHFYYSIILISL